MTAIDDIRAERARQDAKWGEQNHPDGTGPLVVALYDAASLAPNPEGGTLNSFTLARAAWLAQAFTHATNVKAREGGVTWRDILLEEVFEAMAEDDEEELRRELIQVAAVASQWAEAIDRRTPQPVVDPTLPPPLWEEPEEVVSSEHPSGQ